MGVALVDDDEACPRGVGGKIRLVDASALPKGGGGSVVDAEEAAVASTLGIVALAGWVEVLVKVGGDGDG